MQQCATFHPSIRFTAHAQLRSKQRGLREALISNVYLYADVETHVGGSCSRLSISSRELHRLVAEGHLSPSDAERCKNLTLIVDGDAVITAYRH
jgi:hypothetical protein